MTIYLYNDDGVSQDGIMHFQNTFSVIFDQRYRVKLISANEVLSKSWQKDAILFVIGGGRDIPYHEKLKGKANQKITQFVQNGGAFLGVCAGAYYASASFSFAANTAYAIDAKRELCFFPGRSIGPFQAEYDPHSNKEAKSQNIFFKKKSDSMHLFYNGGGYFEDADPKEVIASFDKSHTYPAIVLRKFGKGRVLLSGVHFEYDSKHFDSTDRHMQKLQPKLTGDDKKRLEFVDEILHSLVKAIN